MITSVAAKDAELPVELDEAKRHLCVLNGDYDEHIRSLIAAATEYCESASGRALRASQTLTQSYCQWPCAPVRFDREPVIAVSHVKYYVDDALVTLDPANYRLHRSSEAASHLAWAEGFVAPSHDVRDDAVIVTYTAGYGAAASVPEMAKHAIKLLVGHWFNHTEAVNIGNVTSTVPMATDALLSQLNTGVYR